MAGGAAAQEAGPPVPGEIARNDARGLLQRCRSAQRLVEGATLAPSEQAAAESCIAWVEGFHWGHAWAAWIRGSDMWYCLPAPFDPRASVAALVRYLEGHPGRLDEKAHVLTIAAFLDAYPCQAPPP